MLLCCAGSGLVSRASSAASRKCLRFQPRARARAQALCKSSGKNETRQNTFVLPSRVVIIFFFVVYKIVVVVDLQLPLKCDNNTRIYVSSLEGMD